MFMLNYGLCFHFVDGINYTLNEKNETAKYHTAANFLCFGSLCTQGEAGVRRAGSGPCCYSFCHIVLDVTLPCHAPPRTHTHTHPVTYCMTPRQYLAQKP